MNCGFVFLLQQREQGIHAVHQGSVVRGRSRSRRELSRGGERLAIDRQVPALAQEARALGALVDLVLEYRPHFLTSRHGRPQ